MPALDQASLYNQAVSNGYSNGCDCSQYMLLKLGLLQYIASIVAPTMATDYQSLLNSVNVPGYRVTSNIGNAGLYELALLQIIANNVGTGGVYVQNFGGANPGTVLAVAPVGNAVAMDTGTGAVWGYNGTTWTQFIA